MFDHTLRVVTVALLFAAAAVLVDLWFLDGAYLPAALLVAFVVGALVAVLTGVGPR